MTVPTNPAEWTCRDSQWAAWQGAEALREGRIELGYHLAKLALQAWRVEQQQPTPISPPAPAGQPYNQEQARPIDLTAYRQTQRPDLYDGLINGARPNQYGHIDERPDLPDRVVQQFRVEDVAAAAAAELLNNTQVMPAVPPEPGQVTRSARCRAQVITSATLDGQTTTGECHGVLAWAEHPTDPSASGWMHVDHQLDDHAPLA